MSISFPVTLPLSGMVASIAITPVVAQARVASPFTFKTQSQVWGGQLWQADVSIVPAKRGSMEPLIAALMSLNGYEGSFLLGDTANTAPRGVGTGTPLVNGGSQTGQSLVTDGWTAGVTGILKAGDWVQLTHGTTKRLYKQLVDVDSDGSGNATLTLWPNLRAGLADNSSVVVSSPKGTFMLAEIPDWSINSRKVYGFAFKAVEDLR